MKQINVIVKNVGQDPREETIDGSLQSFQGIVSGHTETKAIRVIAEGRIVMITCDESSTRLTNFVLPEQGTVRGPAVFMKRSWTGENLSLTRSESSQLISDLKKFSVSEPLPPAAVDAEAPEKYLSDMHQCMIVPVDPPDEHGNLLTPVEVIAGIGKQIGYQYKLVPIANQQVYGTAISCMEAQGHRFQIKDEETMLLTFESDQGGTLDRFMRVIEITKLDDVRLK